MQVAVPDRSAADVPAWAKVVPVKDRDTRVLARVSELAVSWDPVRELLRGSPWFATLLQPDTASAKQGRAQVLHGCDS